MRPHTPPRRQPAPAVQAALLTDLLHRGRSGFVELIAATRVPGGPLVEFDRGHFVRAGRTDAFLRDLRSMRGDRVELFFTPATFARTIAGNEGVTGLAVAWVDIDDPGRLAELGRFPHRPHAVVASGSGGAHAYWLLAEEVPAGCGVSLNRRLAAALGGDPVSANRGRILRVPGSLNYKAAGPGRPPRACVLTTYEPSRPRHRPADLAHGLVDPRAPGRAPTATGSARPWQSLEAVDYYRTLTGTEPRRRGAVRCPSLSHEDRHPSARLYPGPGRGWYCFACGAGGGAVDMVAAQRGLPTGSALRGAEFRACLEELHDRLGPAASPRA
jgi:hypothetical protein